MTGDELKEQVDSSRYFLFSEFDRHLVESMLFNGKTHLWKDSLPTKLSGLVLLLLNS
jgi:hypothetical protein